jgi:predicted porin
MDVFASTFTSEFEVFDTVNAEEMITLGLTPAAGVKVAIDIASGEDLGDVISVGATYSIKGLDLGAGYTSADYTDDSFNEDELVKQSSYSLGLGFDFGTVGVAGLYAGVVHEATEDSAQNLDTDVTSMTVGYSVTPALKLSAGYAMGSTANVEDVVVDVDTMRFAVDYAMSSELTLKAGYAQVDEELKEHGKDSIVTAGFIYAF